ncbi:hypothetical protein LXL04_038218 [Taraxacum kok-saghyz]
MLPMVEMTYNKAKHAITYTPVTNSAKMVDYKGYAGGGVNIRDDEVGSNDLSCFTSIATKRILSGLDHFTSRTWKDSKVFLVDKQNQLKNLKSYYWKAEVEEENNERIWNADAYIEASLNASIHSRSSPRRPNALQASLNEG